MFLECFNFLKRFKPFLTHATGTVLGHHLADPTSPASAPATRHPHTCRRRAAADRQRRLSTTPSPRPYPSPLHGRPIPPLLCSMLPTPLKWAPPRPAPPFLPPPHSLPHWSCEHHLLPPYLWSTAIAGAPPAHRDLERAPSLSLGEVHPRAAISPFEALSLHHYRASRVSPSLHHLARCGGLVSLVLATTTALHLVAAPDASSCATVLVSSTVTAR
jgi:hypothetical protein